MLFTQLLFKVKHSACPVWLGSYHCTHVHQRCQTYGSGRVVWPTGLPEGMEIRGALSGGEAHHSHWDRDAWCRCVSAVMGER